MNRRDRESNLRRQATSAIENERGSFQPPIGSCVPVRNLSRTNFCRPFNRKCVPSNRIKGSLFSLQSERRIRESAAIHRDKRADLPAAHSPREQPPRETIRKNPKQFGTSRYEKEPDNRLSLPSKICGGEGGIRTPGPFRVNGFQDRRDRPLRHLSVSKSIQPDGRRLTFRQTTEPIGPYYTIIRIRGGRLFAHDLVFDSPTGSATASLRQFCHSFANGPDT